MIVVIAIALMACLALEFTPYKRLRVAALILTLALNLYLLCGLSHLVALTQHQFLSSYNRISEAFQGGNDAVVRDAFIKYDELVKQGNSAWTAQWVVKEYLLSNQINTGASNKFQEGVGEELAETSE